VADVSSSRHVVVRAARSSAPKHLLEDGAMSTIRSSREIDSVFRTARRAAHPLVIAMAAPTPGGRAASGRVAYIAGKKLGSAVVRNRAKRLLRAATRQAGGPWPGSDVLLIARPATITASSPEIASAVAAVARRLGLPT
jgi:ribonuclease P protein component